MRPFFFSKLSIVSCGIKASATSHSHHNDRRHIPAWIALSLVCLTGCSTVDEFGQSTVHPLRAGAQMMAHAGDRIGDVWEGRRSTPSSSCPPSSLSNSNTQFAQKIPTLPTSPTLAASPSSAAQTAGHLAPVTNSSATASAANSPRVPQPINDIASTSRVEILSPPPAVSVAEAEAEAKEDAKLAAIQTAAAARNSSEQTSSTNATPPSAKIPSVQPTPADMKSLRAADAPAPISPAAISATPISGSRVITPPANLVENAAWCRIRVRNTSQQPATQVSVSVIGPASAQLVSHDGKTASAPVSRMDFAPVPTVAPGEEVILVTGVVSKDETSNRVRVQVRDAQGGANQELQARWQVTIEPVEKP